MLANVNTQQSVRILKNMKSAVIILLSSLALTDFALAEASQDGKSTAIAEFKEAQTCYREYNEAQNWLGAATCSKRSLSIGLELFDEGSSNLASLRHNHGLILAKNKEFKDSISFLESAGEDYRAIYGRKSENYGWLLIDLADAQTRFQVNDSYKNYEKAFKILASLKSENPLIYADLVLDVSFLISRNQLNRRAYAVAQGLAEEAYSAFSQGSDYPIKSSLSAFLVGKFMYYKKDYDDAIPMLQKATKHISTAPYAHGLLATIYSETGRTALASEHQDALRRPNENRGEDTSYVPVFTPNPKYPRTAQRLGIEGYAIVELTITESGSASNIELVKESPKKYGFGKAALKAAKKLKYTPRIVDGKAQEVPGVFYRYTFSFIK